jgi:hypothetical protein
VQAWVHGQSVHSYAFAGTGGRRPSAAPSAAPAGGSLSTGRADGSSLRSGGRGGGGGGRGGAQWPRDRAGVIWLGGADLAGNWEAELKGRLAASGIVCKF